MRTWALIRGLCAEKKLMVFASGYADLVDEATRCFGWDIKPGYVRLATRSKGRLLNKPKLDG